MQPPNGRDDLPPPEEPADGAPTPGGEPSGLEQTPIDPPGPERTPAAPAPGDEPPAEAEQFVGGVPTPQPGLPGAPEEAAVAAAPVRTGARAVILGAIVVLALFAGAAALLLRNTSSVGDLERFVPSDPYVFVKVTLRPDGEQGAALDRLLGRFPEQIRDQDRIDAFLNTATQEFGLDFARDVKPWVGSAAALAVIDAGGSEPLPVGVVSVRNRGAAEAALSKAAAGGEVLYLVGEEVAYIAEDTRAIDSIRGTTEETSLARNGAYADSLADAGGEGLATVWFNGPKFAELATSSGLAPNLPGLPTANSQEAVAMTLRAEDEGLVLTGSAAVAPEQAGTPGAPALLEATAANQLGSLTLFDLGAVFENMITALAGVQQGAPGAGIPDPLEFARSFVRQTFGLDLEDDLLPWMHGEFSVIVGGFSLPVPDIGILIQPTDEEALGRTITALRNRLDSFGLAVEPDGDGFNVLVENAFEVVVRRAPGKLAIAGSSRYADALLEGSAESLAQDTVYRRAVGPSSEGLVFQMFVRVDRIRDTITGFIPADARQGYEEGVAPFLAPLEAFAIRATMDGDRSTFRAVLTISEG